MGPLDYVLVVPGMLFGSYGMPVSVLVYGECVQSTRTFRKKYLLHIVMLVCRVDLWYQGVHRAVCRVVSWTKLSRAAVSSQC